VHRNCFFSLGIRKKDLHKKSAQTLEQCSPEMLRNLCIRRFWALGLYRLPEKTVFVFIFWGLPRSSQWISREMKTAD